MASVDIFLLYLHIICGYQYDKAVNKNDTRELKWYDITSQGELSIQIDYNNLVGPFGLHVIF